MTPSAYLARIGYHGQPAADLATLRALHLAHMRTVPFENLDIHADRAIVLGEEALYAKIVGRRRGGICYELNGLFAWLLRSIGFDVTLLAANVHVDADRLTPDFDHMVLLVAIGGKRYLADVGFGDSFLLPLALDQDGFQDDGVAQYGVRQANGDYTLVRANASDREAPPTPLFRFQATPRILDDFHDRCGFHQHSPDTHFRRKIVCSRAGEAGRITLRGDELIVARGLERDVTPVTTPAQVEAILREHFGVVRDGGANPG